MDLHRHDGFLWGYKLTFMPVSLIPKDAMVLHYLGPVWELSLFKSELKYFEDFFYLLMWNFLFFSLILFWVKEDIFVVVKSSGFGETLMILMLGMKIVISKYLLNEWVKEWMLHNQLKKIIIDHSYSHPKWDMVCCCRLSIAWLWQVTLSEMGNSHTNLKWKVFVLPAHNYL